MSKRKVCLAIIPLALVTLLGLFLAYAAAQTWATVSGLVVDEDGQPGPTWAAATIALPQRR